jgi:hypothetical protein
MYWRFAFVLAIGMTCWTNRSLAQVVPQPSSTTPPGVAASPSVEANQNSHARARTSSPGTPVNPGEAASPSVQANQNMNAPATSTTPNDSAVTPGPGAAPSVARNAGAASDAPHQ